MNKLFSSLRCRGKWLQMWNWGVWRRVGWPSWNKAFIIILPLHHPAAADRNTDWIRSVVLAWYHSLAVRPYQAAPDNRPTAGLWPWFCPPLLCLEGHMLFLDNQSHRATRSYLKSLHGSLPNYPRSVQLSEAYAVRHPIGNSLHGVCRSWKSRVFQVYYLKERSQLNIAASFKIFYSCAVTCSLSFSYYCFIFFCSVWYTEARPCLSE